MKREVEVRSPMALVQLLATVLIPAGYRWYSIKAAR